PSKRIGRRTLLLGYRQCSRYCGATGVVTPIAIDVVKLSRMARGTIEQCGMAGRALRLVSVRDCVPLAPPGGQRLCERYCRAIYATGEHRPEPVKNSPSTIPLELRTDNSILPGMGSISQCKQRIGHHLFSISIAKARQLRAPSRGKNACGIARLRCS